MRTLVFLVILLGLGLCVTGLVSLLAFGLPDLAIEIIGLGANVTALAYTSIFLTGQWPKFRINRSGIYLSIALFLLSASLFILENLSGGLLLYAPIIFLIAGAVGFQLSARKIRN